MPTGSKPPPGVGQAASAVVVLGAGRGLGSVLRALRAEQLAPTVLVSIAYEGSANDDRWHRSIGSSVEDLRRSLDALSEHPGGLARAINRPLTFESLGRHPLGNLLIASLAAAFGDYARATVWLGRQLGVAGAVLPATVAPVQREIEAPSGAPEAEFRAASGARLRRLRCVGDRVGSPRAAIAAITDARLALLAPGALYRSVLSTAAVPDLTSALSRTSARVVWIANLEPDRAEAPDMSAMDHLRALRLHGIRVDAVLHDPSAGLRFDPEELGASGVESIPHPLRSHENIALHDPGRLRAALRAVISSGPRTTVANQL